MLREFGNFIFKVIVTCLKSNFHTDPIRPLQNIPITLYDWDYYCSTNVGKQDLDLF